jgi:hypothetical protein
LKSLRGSARNLYNRNKIEFKEEIDNLSKKIIRFALKVHELSEPITFVIEKEYLILAL